jgi:isoquinoline 1-oxidoreductase alpha subunit
VKFPAIRRRTTVLQMTFRLKVNGTDVSVDVPADTPLLWVIWEQLKLTGTKFGCGVGLCGACVVHIDG